jgi:transcriptional regulator with XRE-family HTH domain
MADKKIDYDKLIDMVAQGWSQRHMAKALRVEPSTVHRYLKRLRAHAPKIMALEKSGKYAEVQLTFIEQYNEGIEALLRLKRALEDYIYRGDRTTFAAMQRKVESKSIEHGDEEGKIPGGKPKGSGRKTKAEMRIEHFDFSVDPKALLVQVTRGIADYLRLKVEFFNTCMDAEILMPFLRDVVNIMETKLPPDLKHEIEETLKRHQLISSVITFSAPIETDLRS